MTADDLALLAHRLYRRSYLHDPFRSCSRRGGSGDRGGHRYHAPGAHVAHRGLAGPSATKQNTKRSPTRTSARSSAVLSIVLVACCGAVSTASRRPLRSSSTTPPSATRRPRSRAPACPAPAAPRRGPSSTSGAPSGWVQYWIWFEDNTQDRGVLRSGRHAGDWELVQYRADGTEAVYAQHSGAERCATRDVERRGGRPVVYVANGSHASYFHAGTRDRMWPDPNDEADGRGAVLRPRAVRVAAGSPGWMRIPRTVGRRPRRLVPARAVLTPGPGLPGRPLGRPGGVRPLGAAVHGAAVRRGRRLRRPRDGAGRRCRRAGRAGRLRAAAAAPANGAALNPELFGLRPNNSGLDAVDVRSAQHKAPRRHGQ